MPLSIERNNFKTGLFLEEAEFKLEQQYHSLLRRRLNFGLFEKAGIVIGLELNYDGVSGTVTVQPGVALVRDSAAQEARELLVTSSATVPVTGAPGSTRFIVLSYKEVNGPDKLPVSPARIQEVADLQESAAAPGDVNLNVVLGQVTIGTALGGPAPGRQLAVVRSSLLGAPMPTVTVTSFTPAIGAPGTAVTIAGTNFTGATAVGFGGVAATAFTVNSATQITATVPPGAVTGKVRVTAPVGFGESVGNFTVTGAVLPTITSFTPTSGTSGTVVTITGTNFTGATAVTFGGVPAAAFTVNSAIQITATVPPGAVTGRIRVTTGTGSGDSTIDFTIALAPVIKSILPTSQAAGGTIVIRGANIRSGALNPGDSATGTIVRFVDPGNSANVVVATTGTVLTDVAVGTGPQRVQITVPPRGTLPLIVNIVLEIGGLTSTTAFTYA